MKKISINQALQSDIPQIFEIYQSLIPFDFSLEQAQTTYENIHKNKNYCLVVAKKEDIILGTALGICVQTLAAPFLVIEDVIVKEEVRGKGIGKQLILALEEFAQQKKCAYAILVSSGHRKVAHQFYQNVGFSEDVVGFRKMYVNK